MSQRTRLSSRQSSFAHLPQNAEKNNGSATPGEPTGERGAPPLFEESRPERELK